MIDCCFPKKLNKFKSTDDPWITPEIKKKVATRKRYFQRVKKRTEEWGRLKKISDDAIKKSKTDFFNNFKSRAADESNPALYYKVVNLLKDKEKPSMFNITSLRPNNSDAQTVDELAAYFGAISADFPPLSESDRQAAVIQNEEMMPIEYYQMAHRLKTCKKNQNRPFIATFPRNWWRNILISWRSH